MIKGSPQKHLVKTILQITLQMLLYIFFFRNIGNPMGCQKLEVLTLHVNYLKDNFLQAEPTQY